MALRLRVEQLEARELLSGDPPVDPFLLTPVDPNTPLAIHIHAHLHLSLDGQGVVIPANIGVFQAGALPLHTHDTSGTLHVESPIVRTFILADFFTIWKQTAQGRALVDQLHAAQTTSTTVNGQASANFDALVLHDHDDIVIRAQSRPADQDSARNQTFVAQIYRDLLHREPDASGWATFRAALDAGVSRVQVVQVIESSTEYRRLQVQQIYVSVLHRPADENGLGNAVSLLTAGSRSEQVLAMVLGSVEYFQRAGGGNGSFVNALYGDVLHRAADSAGAALWNSALAGGASRAAVAQQVVESFESRQNQVQTFYQQFLHRPADNSGQATFATALNQGARAEQIIALLLASDEYSARL